MPWSFLLQPTVLLGIALAGALGWGSIQTWRLEAANGRIETVKSEYAQRDAKAQAEATAALKAATDRVRAAEDKSQADVAAVSAKLQTEVKNVAAQKDRVIGQLHTGQLALRVQLDTSRAGPGDSSASSQAGGSPGSGTGPTTSGFLSELDAAFLVSEASRADEIVAQLSAAQAVIVKDREICR